MPRRSRDVFLRDALLAADKIVRWTSGQTLDSYAGDDLLQSAVERQFDIFSEALRNANHLDDSVGTHVPNLREIIGQRNMLTHQYFGIEVPLVWSAVTTTLPLARDRIRRLLSEPDDQPEGHP